MKDKRYEGGRAQNNDKRPNYIKVTKNNIVIAAIVVVVIGAIAFNSFFKNNSPSTELVSNEPTIYAENVEPTISYDFTEETASDDITDDPTTAYDITEEPVSEDVSEDITEDTSAYDITEAPTTTFDIAEDPTVDDTTEDTSWNDTTQDTSSDDTIEPTYYPEETPSDSYDESTDAQEVTVIKDQLNDHYVDTVNYLEDTSLSYSPATAQTISVQFETIAGTLSTTDEVDYYHIYNYDDYYDEIHVVLDPQYEIDFYNIRICIVDQNFNVLYDGKAYDPSIDFIRYNAIAYTEGDYYIAIYRIDSDSYWEMNYELYYFTY